MSASSIPPRPSSEAIAGTIAQFIHSVFVESFDFQHFGDGYISDFFKRGKTFLRKNVGNFLVDIEFFHEQTANHRSLRGCLIGRLFSGHDVDLPACQLAGQTNVLTTATNRNRQVFFVDHNIHRMLVFVHHDG
jgi:hypothetical protein